MARVLELATTVGNKCRNLWVHAHEDVTAEVMEVSGPLQFSGNLNYIILASFQFATSYRPRRGDCPVKWMRVILGSCLILMSSLSHIIPFDVSQLVSKPGDKINNGTFKHIDSVSGRRFKIGVTWFWRDSDKWYFIESLRFSLSG